MTKDLINREYWREAHLLPLLCSTDAFYVKYARKIRDEIKKADVERKLSADDATEIALTLTYYFEDVVSGLGSWRAFIMEHKRMYGTYLPFYEPDEEQYYVDEVNEEDVRFLIWMTFQKKNSQIIVNPENSYLQKIAHEIFGQLDRDFERAPINTELLEAMKNPVLYRDFYNLKTLMVQVCCMSYLFYYFTAQHRRNVIRQVEAVVGEGKPISVVEYFTESILGVHEKTGPLSLKPQVWVSRMLEIWDMNEEANALKQMVSREIQVYRIVEVTDERVLLEDCDGKQCEMDLKDMGQMNAGMLRKKKMMIGSLVLYRGKWYPNGGVSWGENERLFLEYKEQKAKRLKQNRDTCEQVLAANEGCPYLFFENYEAMKDWMKQNVKDEVLSDVLEKQEEKHEPEKEILAFVSAESGIMALPGGACCVRHDRNPYYDANKAPQEALRILFDPFYSAPEMVRSLVRDRLLPDAALFSEVSPERGRKLLRDNLDFLLRVIRPDM